MLFREVVPDGGGGCFALGEAGALVIDAAGCALTTTDPLARRTFLAAGDESLLADLRAARAG